MPRTARLLMKDEPGVYHVISRTALDGFVLGDSEKEFLLKHIQRLSTVYFAEILGFCLMGNHFHLLVRMLPGSSFQDEEVQRRFRLYYANDPKKELHRHRIAEYRDKWENLSEFIKEIKQGFSRYYNRKHRRKGFFWAERFKSLLVQNGDTLINCLAYIDLNPVRAGIVEKPEEYRWSSIGYHVQSGNKHNFLSLDFGLRENYPTSNKDRFAGYRAYVYEKGGLTPESTESAPLSLPLSNKDRFRYRTRYFIDSGVIGSREFVQEIYGRFRDLFSSKNDKIPRRISGVSGMYSLKRLSENIR